MVLHRLRVWSLAFSFALIAGAMTALVMSTGIQRNEGRIGGDFVAFYAAGSIVRDGHAQSLYEPSVQAAAQARFLPGVRRGGYVPFPYPTPVAVLYAPLSSLDYRVAYGLHFFASLAAVTLAAWCFASAYPATAGRDWLAVRGVLGCTWPLWHATEIGQNTPFTLACFAMLTAALANEWFLLTGVAVGVLLLKPTLGVFAFPLLFLQRNARTWGAFVATAFLWFVLGAVASGSSWPLLWLRALQGFAANDHARDFAWSLSLWSLAERSLRGAGVFAGLATVLLLGVAAWKTKDARARVALAAMGAVLVPSHAGFYEAALCVLPGMFVLDRVGSSTALPFLGLWLVSALGYASRQGLVMVYLVPVLVLTLWLVFLSWRRGAASTD